MFTLVAACWLPDGSMLAACSTVGGLLPAWWKISGSLGPMLNFLCL